uniref:Uncharacterized protein n=1 Tax=Fusarium oxysporum (strain Fo5176) TaxID=660025 RepID=A0A0D2Y3U0_FUSOF
MGVIDIELLEHAMSAGDAKIDAAVNVRHASHALRIIGHAAMDPPRNEDYDQVM